MRRLDRYIVQTVASAVMMVMMVVLSLDLVFAFIAEVEDFEAGYGTQQALTYVLTTLPRRIYDYLPLGAFMGCLIGLGVLAKNSELVVVRAAGVSLWRIVFSVMKPILVLVFVGMLIGEYVVPFSEKIAQSRKSVALGAGDRISTVSGLWHKEGNSFIHVNAVEPNGILYGVSIQTYGDARSLSSTAFAERAIFQRGEWLLEEVRITRLQDGALESAEASSLAWSTELTPSVLSLLIVKPDTLSIKGLYQYVQYLQEQNLNAAQYLLAFWKKVLQPLSTGVLVFVAIAFVFGPLRTATMGYRVFCGLIVGLIFKYMQDLLGPSSLVFGFAPIWATLIPIAISGMLGAYLIRKVG